MPDNIVTEDCYTPLKEALELISQDHKKREVLDAQAREMLREMIDTIKIGKSTGDDITDHILLKFEHPLEKGVGKWIKKTVDPFSFLSSIEGWHKTRQDLEEHRGKRVMIDYKERNPYSGFSPLEHRLPYYITEVGILVQTGPLLVVEKSDDDPIGRISYNTNGRYKKYTVSEGQISMEYPLFDAVKEEEIVGNMPYSPKGKTYSRYYGADGNEKMQRLFDKQEKEREIRTQYVREHPEEQKVLDELIREIEEEKAGSKQ